MEAEQIEVQCDACHDLTGAVNDPVRPDELNVALHDPGAVFTDDGG